ncbi:MAG: hypothetical protein QOG89_3397 [Thermomicrobiales bacterium]|nr:hypothetical protein [Thermomicrobiales bacterium]
MDNQPLLHYEVAYPERLSRLLIFVKWLLVIPHLFVIAILGFALYVTTFFAWFAILIVGRYPRGLWDFAMMTLRWQARLNAYIYLQRDEYPPFGDGDYPVTFEMAYPERMSRLLIFVKWLLIIPHAIVLYILGVALYVVWLIAWFAILITGRYPQGMFDFVTGVSRWAYRVTAYVLMLTDAYPPFTLSAPAVPPATMAPRPSF